MEKPPRQQGSWGQHGAHLGPVGPRWAPCWPHEPCYQGYDWHKLCYFDLPSMISNDHSTTNVVIGSRVPGLWYLRPELMGGKIILSLHVSTHAACMGGAYTALWGNIEHCRKLKCCLCSPHRTVMHMVCVCLHAGDCRACVLIHNVYIHMHMHLQITND